MQLQIHCVPNHIVGIYNVALLPYDDATNQNNGRVNIRDGASKAFIV